MEPREEGSEEPLAQPLISAAPAFLVFFRWKISIPGCLKFCSMNYCERRAGGVEGLKDEEKRRKQKDESGTVAESRKEGKALSKSLQGQGSSPGAECCFLALLAPLGAGWDGGVGVRIENHLTSCCTGTLWLSLFIHSEMKGGAEKCIFFRTLLNFHLSQLCRDALLGLDAPGPERDWGGWGGWGGLRIWMDGGTGSTGVDWKEGLFL